MDFVKLTEGQRRSFDEDGFLVVPNVLTKEEVARLVEASDRLAAPLLNKPELAGRPEYNHLDLRPGLLREEALFRLVAHSKTVPLVVQLLSPNIHLHSTTLIYKRPEAPDDPPFRRGWHRDIRIPRDLGHEHLPLVGMKICYCLTDFQESSCGMTLMARGTHKRMEPLKIPRGGIDPVGVEVCDLRVNAGDAIIFENRIFHTATPNRSRRTSKVLMYGYAYRWMKQEIYLERLDPALLEGVSPVVRQLLGGYHDIDTVPWALQHWARKNGVLPKPVPWEVEA